MATLTCSRTKRNRSGECLSCVLFLLAWGSVWPAAQTPPVPSHPPTRSDQNVPFAVGETLIYDVSWSSFVTAGQATLTVRERTSAAGGTAYHLVADGRPTALVSQLYNLYYRVESWLDTSNLLPRRGSTYFEEGSRKRSTLITFDQRAHQATYEGGGSRKNLDVPPLVQDPLSALYVLRALGLSSGAELSMPIVNNGELIRTAMTAGKAESIECALGTVRAMRVNIKMTDTKGEPVGQNTVVWLTTGRRRVPVQIQADLPIGSFRLVLREARGLGR
jgi:hypothetical protein